MKKILCTLVLFTGITLAACNSDRGTQESADSSLSDTAVFDTSAVDSVQAVDSAVKSNTTVDSPQAADPPARQP